MSQRNISIVLLIGLFNMASVNARDHSEAPSNQEMKCTAEDKDQCDATHLIQKSVVVKKHEKSAPPPRTTSISLSVKQRQDAWRLLAKTGKFEPPPGCRDTMATFPDCAALHEMQECLNGGKCPDEIPHLCDEGDIYAACFTPENKEEELGPDPCLEAVMNNTACWTFKNEFNESVIEECFKDEEKCPKEEEEVPPPCLTTEIHIACNKPGEEEEMGPDPCLEAVEATPACWNLPEIQSCIKDAEKCPETDEEVPEVCKTPMIHAACGSSEKEEEFGPDPCMQAIESVPECWHHHVMQECFHDNCKCPKSPEEVPPECHTMEIKMACEPPCEGDLHKDEEMGPDPCLEAIEATPACWDLPEVQACFEDHEKCPKTDKEIPPPCNIPEIHMACDPEYKEEYMEEEYDKKEDWEDKKEDWEDKKEDWEDKKEDWDDKKEDWEDKKEDKDDKKEDWEDKKEDKDDKKDWKDKKEDWYDKKEDWEDKKEDEHYDNPNVTMPPNASMPPNVSALEHKRSKLGKKSVQWLATLGRKHQRKQRMHPADILRSMKEAVMSKHHTARKWLSQKSTKHHRKPVHAPDLALKQSSLACQQKRQTALRSVYKTCKKSHRKPKLVMKQNLAARKWFSKKGKRVLKQ